MVGLQPLQVLRQLIVLLLQLHQLCLPAHPPALQIPPLLPLALDLPRQIVHHCLQWPCTLVTALMMTQFMMRHDGHSRGSILLNQGYVQLSFLAAHMAAHLSQVPMQLQQLSSASPTSSPKPAIDKPVCPFLNIACITTCSALSLCHRMLSIFLEEFSLPLMALHWTSEPSQLRRPALLYRRNQL